MLSRIICRYRLRLLLVS